MKPLNEPAASTAPLRPVIQVVRELHPNGGVSGVAYALREAFDQLGVPNSVLTLETVTGRAPAASPSKLRLLRDVVVFSVLGTSAISRARRKQPHAIIINHSDALGGDIYVDHGLHKAMVVERPGMLLRNPLHLFILLREEIRHRRRLYRAVVCLSKQGVDNLRRVFPSTRAARVYSIPNGIDLGRFFPDEAQSAEKRGCFRLVFVGHEFERKGLGLILAALRDVPGAQLTVVGGNLGLIATYRGLASSLGVAERVDFLGRQSDVGAVLRRSDLLILPSIAEAWPLVTLESMACGTPVLMTDVAAGPEIVGDAVGGLLIERTAADIAAKVNMLMNDGSKFSELRQGALRKAALYPWAEIARTYYDLGLELAGGHPLHANQSEEQPSRRTQR